MQHKYENPKQLGTEPDSAVDGAKLEPNSSLERRVYESALSQYATAAETNEEWAGHALFLIDCTGDTAADFFDQSFQSLIVAAAFEIYKPEEGPEFVTSCAIAEAARKEFRQVRMCMCSRS